MLHAKFEDHRTSGSLEKIFELFTIIIWAWRSFCSCELDHLYQRSCPLSMKAPYEI